MDDYKVLLTFSPSFELWGTSNDDGDRHRRVVYLAMVEWDKRLNGKPWREVLAFDCDGDVVNIATGHGRFGPCETVYDPSWLGCAGHAL